MEETLQVCLALPSGLGLEDILGQIRNYCTSK